MYIQVAPSTAANCFAVLAQANRRAVVNASRYLYFDRLLAALDTAAVASKQEDSVIQVSAVIRKDFIANVVDSRVDPPLTPVEPPAPQVPPAPPAPPALVLLPWPRSLPPLPPAPPSPPEAELPP